MADLSGFKELYISEVEDHLQKLNDNLLKLEKNNKNKELLQELMRSAHSIKGSSATMGYKKNAFLAHVMEDVFDYARNDVLEITPKITNVLFSAFDEFSLSLKQIKKNNKEINVEKISKKLKSITGVETEGAGKSKRNISGEPIVKSKFKKVKIENNIKIKSEGIEDIEGVSHIKVNIEKLDNLMDLVEELIIDKMKLESLELKGPQEIKLIQHLTRLISDIQYQVMQTRLVPLNQIFARFPRMVRDLSLSQKKKVEFVVDDGDLKLDRTILDQLGEALVHLLRNAVDHGIEKVGQIKLTAKREKDFAIILVQDNGQGIDWSKVIEVAKKKNIINVKQAQEYLEDSDKPGVRDLIFNPNLSTNIKVTEVSGRGVGLSVVKKFTDRVGGLVKVESPLENGGTRFMLKLPFSLAIVKALLVKVGGMTMAIPFSVIERTVTFDKKEIKSMVDYDIAIIEGIRVPIVNLKKIFNINNEKRIFEEKNNILVTVNYEEDIAGLFVDEIIDEKEIVVKALPPEIRDVKGFSGTSILGDGKTILIIDVLSLLEDSRKYIRIENSNNKNYEQKT